MYAPHASCKDRRHGRPFELHAREAARPVSRRRRCLSAEFQSWHAGRASQPLEAIRAIEKDLGRPIGILMDLQGPKLRVGTFGAGFIELAPGQRLHLDLDAAPGDSKRVGLPHPEIFAALKPDTSLLLDDGKLRVVVKSCGAGWRTRKCLSAAGSLTARASTFPT